MNEPDLNRGFIGDEHTEQALASATKCSRNSAIKNFERFMLQFPDLMKPPLTEAQSRICDLFGKKSFHFIFAESKNLYFEEKLSILQNFIFNAEKYNQV